MTDTLPAPFAPIPRLGLGTWPMKGPDCEAAVISALAMGYRHVDTAEMYGNEDAVGAALRQTEVPRGDIFLTTKAWWDKPRGDAIRRACEASLKRLRQPYVDLYLIHWPAPDLDLPDALRGLAKIQADGLARHVGVANFPAGMMRRAIEADIVPLSCVQVEHHAFLSQARLREVVTPRGIALTSYTPVAKGEVARDPVILGIAAKHGATPSQVALAYLLAMPGVVAIPKSASPARQRENLDALAVRLDAADIAALDALPKGRRMVNPGFAPDWNA